MTPGSSSTIFSQDTGPKESHIDFRLQFEARRAIQPWCERGAKLLTIENDITRKLWRCAGWQIRQLAPLSDLETRYIGFVVNSLAMRVHDVVLEALKEENGSYLGICSIHDERNALRTVRSRLCAQSIWLARICDATEQMEHLEKLVGLADLYSATAQFIPGRVLTKEAVNTLPSPESSTEDAHKAESNTSKEASYRKESENAGKCCSSMVAVSEGPDVNKRFCFDITETSARQRSDTSNSSNEETEPVHTRTPSTFGSKGIPAPNTDTSSPHTRKSSHRAIESNLQHDSPHIETSCMLFFFAGGLLVLGGICVSVASKFVVNYLLACIRESYLV